MSLEQSEKLKREEAAKEKKRLEDEEAKKKLDHIARIQAEREREIAERLVRLFASLDLDFCLSYTNSL